MRAGITVQVMLPGASVAFQSQIDVDDGSVRKVTRELAPKQVWTWRVGNIPRDRIALLAGQSKEAVDVTINGVPTLLEGQNSTDFGLFFARRFEESIGTLPFDGDLTEISIANLTNKRNTITIVVAELPDIDEPAGTDPPEINIEADSDGEFDQPDDAELEPVDQVSAD